MSDRNYFVMVNTYRNSTGEGFANTWRPARCLDRKHQIAVLTQGLPVSDSCWEDSNGNRHPTLSRMGVRSCTATERREAVRDMERDGENAVRVIENHLPESYFVVAD